MYSWVISSPTLDSVEGSGGEPGRASLDTDRGGESYLLLQQLAHLSGLRVPCSGLVLHCSSNPRHTLLASAGHFSVLHLSVTLLSGLVRACHIFFSFVCVFMFVYVCVRAHT